MPLRDWLDALPVAGLARTIAPFEGDDWGSEYLSFRANSLLCVHPPPDGVRADGWAYGEEFAIGGRRGWYPPVYAVECAHIVE